jgi:hypothetical protein
MQIRDIVMETNPVRRNTIYPMDEGIHKSEFVLDRNETTKIGVQSTKRRFVIQRGNKSRRRAGD